MILLSMILQQQTECEIHNHEMDYIKEKRLQDIIPIVMEEANKIATKMIKKSNIFFE